MLSVDVVVVIGSFCLSAQKPIVFLLTVGKSYVYLNGADGHIDADLMITNLLEGAHGETDIVQILDRSAEPFRQVIDKSEYLLHFCAILHVAVPAKSHTPGSRLGTKRCLEMLYRRKGHSQNVERDTQVED